MHSSPHVLILYYGLECKTKTSLKMFMFKAVLGCSSQWYLHRWQYSRQQSPDFRELAWLGLDWVTEDSGVSGVSSSDSEVLGLQLCFILWNTVPNSLHHDSKKCFLVLVTFLVFLGLFSITFFLLYISWKIMERSAD